IFPRLAVRLDLPGRAPGGRAADRSPMLSPQAGGDGTVIKLGEVVMILDLHRQGLSVSAIALQLGVDRKTVRKYLARGLEAPVYGPRQPRPRRIDPFVPCLRSALRDTARRPGAGRLRPVPGGVHRRAGGDPDRLAVLPGARLQPPALGALRPAPGPADRAALPPRRLRRARRRAAPDPYDRMKTAVS